MLAIHGGEILVDDAFRSDVCVLVCDGAIKDIVSQSDAPSQADDYDLNGGYLTAGFIDLQVNGGGGVMFNDAPSVQTIEKIAAAHRAFGTTGFLPTLISDDFDIIREAICAVDEAIKIGAPGVLGIHLEGPFLNAEKRGVHDTKKLLPLDEAAIDLISSLKNGVTLVTLAPEMTMPGQIRALTERGVIVAAGHTNASYAQVNAAIAEGLSGFTHLFNAMSQLGSREPGAVGAALDSDSAWAGIIIDGFHVHDASLRLALKCMSPARVALVTDSMATVGSDIDSFSLGGAIVTSDNGKLTTPQGALAGSTLNMMLAVKNCRERLNVDLATAIQMATSTSSRALGLQNARGSISTNMKADLVHFSSQCDVVETWINGHASASSDRDR
jgi:N-acetylglucosamine-6-phosphate deacetylase